MTRFISTVVAVTLSITVAAVAHADMPTVADRAGPARSISEPAALDPGVQLGTRLARLGRLRTLGDDFDLAVVGLFDVADAMNFRRWRTLADTLTDAADGLPFHRIVIVARAPGYSPSAIDAAGHRAQILVDALSARGVSRDRIESIVAPPSPVGIDLQIRFERIRPPPASEGRVGG